VGKEKWEMDERRNATRIWGLCQECAGAIWGRVAPNAGYQRAVGELLFGTACVESDLRLHRQKGLAFWSERGGFSKWQLELTSIEESARWILDRSALKRRCTNWLFDVGAVEEPTVAPWLYGQHEEILFAMTLRENDRIGALFARLHYLRVAAPVPRTVGEQAAYWKQWYNTESGKGTVGQYLEKWGKYRDLVIE
jgi:hypothetical protein